MLHAAQAWCSPYVAALPCSALLQRQLEAAHKENSEGREVLKQAQQEAEVAKARAHCASRAGQRLLLT